MLSGCSFGGCFELKINKEKIITHIFQ